MSDDRFESEPDSYFEEPSSSGGCLRGCLIAVLIFAIFVVIAGITIYKNWQNLAAEFGSEMVALMVDESDWPEQEKTEVKMEFGRLVTAFREGEISWEELDVVVMEIIESPLWTTMAVAAIEKKYVEESGLTDEEKQAGRVDMRRFIRGMVNGQLIEEDFDAAISKLAVKNDDGLWEMKQSATDDELRELFAVVKEKVDAAEIPPEVEEVDPSEEMKRIIDTALEKVTQEAGAIEEVVDEQPAS